MFTKPFNQISKHDAARAGGKGASLGEMTQAGIPVPPGFVILAGAFEQFLKETDLNVEIDSILHTVNHQEMHTVEHASERIQKLILEAKMPEDIASEIKSEFTKLGAEFVAVRSSATAEDSASAAWAGQLDSFLNTNEETLLANVKKCWASLFTPRAVFYRFETYLRQGFGGQEGLHDQKISVAVVVQKMVASEKSGIAFSVHPVTEDRNQLIIEAGFGLGEAIVSGQITPDSYVVEKDDSKNIVHSLASTEKQVDTQQEAEINPVQKFINLMTGRNLWPPLNNYTFFGQGSAFNTEKYFGDYYPNLPPLHLILITKEGESMQVLPSDTLEYCSRYIFRLYVDGSKEAQNRFRDFDEVEKHISCLYEEYTSQKVSETRTDELLKTMDGIRDRIWRLNCYIMFTLYFDKEICLDVLKNANSSISEKRLNLIWERATHPAVESFEKAQQRYILRTIVENKSREFRIEHARFIFTNYFGVEALEDVAKKVDSEYGTFSNEQALLKLSELDNELSEEKTAFNDWHQTLPKDEQRLVWYIQRIIEYRDRRKNLFAKAYVIWWLIYEKVLLEAQIDHSLITYIQFDEIMRGAEYLKSHHAEIEARKHGAALFIEFNGTITLEPVDYEKAKQQLTEFYIESTTSGQKENEIKGQVGSPGKIQGRVRVVLNASKAEHFEHGDILVTGMTRPEFVPLMKNSSAVITDEGGITCHAAIVSRELKKPCIIGTKFATQVLHDGDLVEVDADNGVVRVMERAKD